MVVQPSSTNPIQPGTTVQATFYWLTVALRSYYANAFVSSALTAALFEAVPDTAAKPQSFDRYCRVDGAWRSSRMRLNDGRRSRGRAAFRCSRRREALGGRSRGRKLGWGAVHAGLCRTLDVLGLAEFDETGRQWLAAATGAVGGWARWSGRRPVPSGLRVSTPAGGRPATRLRGGLLCRVCRHLPTVQEVVVPLRGGSCLHTLHTPVVEGRFFLVDVEFGGRGEP